MTNRYEESFAQAKKSAEKAFIPFTVLGWPDADSCFDHACAMIDAGVTALELGLPFSDPVADGPVIQKAAFETLKSGFKVDDCFRLLERIRRRSQKIPIGLLLYYNLVLAQGVAEFFARCSQVGVDAVLIADLPIESAQEVLPQAQAAGVSLIYLVSPVTTPARLASICRNAGAFLYLVSRLGVTGTNERNDEKDARLQEIIAETRKHSSLPICAGFGISAPEHARTMFKLGADGVITGSRVVEIVRAAQSPEGARQQLSAFCHEMLEACRNFDPARR
ncbi:MAG TPA: tryptophan synthase subunit alpha [Planktothrix sp.]|jgi:tryptophan synthase alpha chain